MQVAGERLRRAHGEHDHGCGDDGQGAHCYSL
jgi:hypothetical protein